MSARMANQGAFQMSRSGAQQSSIHSLDAERLITQGNLLDFPENPIRCMQSLYEKHGELAALQDGSQKLVFVFGPEWNQVVLSDSARFHSRFFAIRGPRRSAHRRLTSGLLSMNGPEHKEHRRMVMGPFQKMAIGNHHAPVAVHTRHMLDDWTIGETRDINVDMTRFMLKVTSSILFGVDQPELACQIGEMIDVWVRMNHQMGMGAFVSDPSFTEGYGHLLQLAEDLEGAIQTMIGLKRSSGKLGHDVLSLLLEAHDADGKLSDDQLVGHTALLFGAAHLTTAHTLCWTLFLLAQHPAVMEELWDELTSKVAGEIPTLEELPQLDVMERILKESMRILPASGYSQRMCAEDVQLGPLALSRGTAVIFSQFITHRIAELYPEPKAFRPDRWRTINPSPYAYLPFGAGPRMCIGAMLAMMTLKTALPTILKRYRLSMSAGSEVNGAIISTMLGPTSPVLMEVHEADGRFESQPVTGNIHDLVTLREAKTTTKTSRKAA
jgi:cytochrome P450